MNFSCRMNNLELAIEDQKDVVNVLAENVCDATGIVEMAGF